jgi:ATP-binding cassette subfamily B protein
MAGPDFAMSSSTQKAGGETVPLPGGSAPQRFRGQLKGIDQIRWRSLFGEGWKLVEICRLLVFVYIVMVLVQGIAAIYASQYIGTLMSNLGTVAHPPQQEVSVGQAPGETSERAKIEGAPERKQASRSVPRIYLKWMLLAMLSVGLAVPLQWCGKKMDLLMSNRIRADLFDRVLQKPPEFFHLQDAGKINTIINSMPVEMQIALRKITVDPLPQLILLVGTTGQIVYNFRQLTGIIPVLGFPMPTLAIPPLIVVVALGFSCFILKMSDGLRQAGRKVQSARLALASLVTGTAQAPEEIQAMRAEEMFSSKHRRALEVALGASLSQETRVAVLNVLSQLPELLVKIVFLGFGLLVAVLAGGSDSVGNIVAILALAPLLITPISTLSASFLMVFQGWPSIETVMSIMEDESRTGKPPIAPDATEIEPTIEARDLVFSYSAHSAKVFDGVSFRIPAGRRTGLVAKLGQGKTTFFKLALRFYDPLQGQILVGGKPTTEYPLATLRQRIAMMSQFPAFFHDTLRENMRMAKSDATDAEIEALCQRTGIWEILQRKVPPINLDSNIAAAQTLSGGQKKLLALTRCLLRDPAILLLDEPTVGMDNQEKFGEILAKLQEATTGKAVIVVDHDVNWLLQFCNYFVVLDRGKIVEQGTMQELLSHKGLLYDLYTITLGPRTTEIATLIAGVGSKD